MWPATSCLGDHRTCTGGTLDNSLIWADSAFELVTRKRGESVPAGQRIAQLTRWWCRGNETVGGAPARWATKLSGPPDAWCRTRGRCSGGPGTAGCVPASVGVGYLSAPVLRGRQRPPRSRLFAGPPARLPPSDPAHAGPQATGACPPGDGPAPRRGRLSR